MITIQRHFIQRLPMGVNLPGKLTRVLKVDYEDGNLCILFELDDSHDRTDHTFKIFYVGDEIPDDYHHMGSAYNSNGECVHLYGKVW